MGGCLPLTHVRMGRDQKDGIVKDQQHIRSSLVNGKKVHNVRVRVKLFEFTFLYFFPLAVSDGMGTL